MLNIYFTDFKTEVQDYFEVEEAGFDDMMLISKTNTQSCDYRLALDPTEFVKTWFESLDISKEDFLNHIKCII